jgi:hypothetical protein
VGEDALGAGDSFTLLTATDGITGTFGQLFLPALADGLFWYNQYLPTEFRATVANVIPGDFNLDGSVDAGDYVHWRQNGGDQSAYDDWAAHFGESVSVSGAASRAITAPEPSSSLLMLLACAMILALRHREGAVSKPPYRATCA